MNETDSHTMNTLNVYNIVGYGLKCHRCIKTICGVIGLKDLHVRVEGNPKNKQSLTKALFQGLETQVHNLIISLILILKNVKWTF